VSIGFVVSFCLGISVMYYCWTRKNNPERILSVEPGSEMASSELDMASSRSQTEITELEKKNTEIENAVGNEDKIGEGGVGDGIEVEKVVEGPEGEQDTGMRLDAEIKAREFAHSVEDMNAVNQMLEDEIVNERETNQ